MNYELLQAGDLRNESRVALNSVESGATTFLIARYGVPIGVLIPYEWLLSAHNGDFVQLVHSLRSLAASKK